MADTGIHPLAIAGAIVASAAAAGVLSEVLRTAPKKKRRRPKKTKTRPKQVSGMRLDEPLEAPPPDIEYDNRPPCQDVDEFQENPNGEEEGGFCIPPRDLEPKKRTSAPFAVGGDRPLWPVMTMDDKKLRVSYQDVRGKWHGKWGRHFGTARQGDDGREKLHAGVDLFADEGDIVRAMEDGTVLATLPFHHGTSAVYVLHDSGVIVNYGEVEHGSWHEFGVEQGVGTGQRVDRGQPLARIGQMHESSMLHLETFTPGTEIEAIRKGELQWDRKQPAPEGLLDPTRYLVRAQRVMYEGPEIT